MTQPSQKSCPSKNFKTTCDAYPGGGGGDSAFCDSFFDNVNPTISQRVLPAPCSVQGVNVTALYGVVAAALYSVVMNVLIKNPNSLWLSESDVTRYIIQRMSGVNVPTLVRVTRRARADFLSTPLALKRQLRPRKSRSKRAKEFEPASLIDTTKKQCAPVCHVKDTPTAPVTLNLDVPKSTVIMTDDEHRIMYDASRKRAEATVARKAKATRAKVQRVRSRVRAILQAASVDPEDTLLDEAGDLPVTVDTAPTAKSRRRRSKDVAPRAEPSQSTTTVDSDPTKLSTVKSRTSRTKTRQRRPAKVDVAEVAEVAEVVEVVPVVPVVDEYDEDVEILEQLLSMTDDARIAFLSESSAPHDDPPSPTHDDPPSPPHDNPPSPPHDDPSSPPHDDPLSPPHDDSASDDYMNDLINDYQNYMDEPSELSELSELSESDEYDDDDFNQLVADFELYGDDDDFNQLVADFDARGAEPFVPSLPFTHPPASALLWQDGEEPVLTERIDMKMNHAIQDNLNELIEEGRLKIKEKTTNTLPRYCSMANAAGEVRVQYTQVDFGRFYAKGAMSLGCLQKTIRGSLSANMIDIDIVNCHPTIALNLCRQNSIPCPLLEQFVKDRDAFIKSIPVEDGEDPITKTTITALLNLSKCRHKGLTEFRGEMSRIVSSVFKLFPKMQATVAPDVENRRVKVVSRIYMMIESNLQRIAMKVFQDAGFTIRVSVYDGFMVDRHATLDPEVVINECVQHIRRHTGYSVRFIVKPQTSVNFDGFVPHPVHTYLPRKRPLSVYAKYAPIVHEELQVQPFFTCTDQTVSFSPGVKLVGVCAPMGSGKSHQVRAYLRQFAECNPMFKCLDVSSRRTQGSASRATMNADGHGFLSYKDGYVDADRLTIQFESLHKVPVYQEYDVLILDEIRSIMDCMTGSTNSKKCDANVAALINLVKSTKHIIMCDADLLIDSAVAVFLELLPDPKSVELHIYPRTHAAFIKTIMIENQSDVISSLRHDIRTGAKIGVVCPLRKRVQFIDQLVQDERCSVKYFHGLSDEREKANCWADPNVEFADTQVVVFNSTVTVGNDIQLQFDQLYVFADSPQGCNFRQLTQMMGRFRAIKSNVIHVAPMGSVVRYVSCLTDDYLDKRDKQLLEYKLEWMFARRTSHVSHYSLELGDYGARWAPDWFIRVRGYNEVLSQKSEFMTRFIEHQLFRGMTVINKTRGNTDEEKEVDVSRQISQLTTKQREIVLFQQILATHGSVATDLITTQIKHGALLDEDQAVLVDLWKTVKPFVFRNLDTRDLHIPDSDTKDVDPFSVTMDVLPVIKFIRRESASLLRSMRLIKGYTDDASGSPYADQYNTFLYRRAVVSLLQALTGSDSDDVTLLMFTENEINQTRVVAAVDAARVLCHLTGTRVPKSDSNDPIKIAVAYVKHTLKCVCLGLQPSARPRIGDGLRGVTYRLHVLKSAKQILDLARDDRYQLITDPTVEELKVVVTKKTQRVVTKPGMLEQYLKC